MAEYIERKAVLDYIDHMPSELTRDGRRMIRRIRLTEYISDSIPAADVVERPRWIPVTERLPDVFKHVLVNIPGMAPHPTVQEAFLEKNGIWYSNSFRYEADEITHWMPLPEPPKEGE